MHRDDNASPNGRVDADGRACRARLPHNVAGKLLRRALSTTTER
jgi:hypothetical protein